MGILWVFEKPGRGSDALAARLQGDFAVRVFASIRNFLRIARSSRIEPDCILIRAEDFPDELDTLDSILLASWAGSQRIYCSAAAIPGLSPESMIYESSQIPELPFFIQKLMRLPKNPTGRLLEVGDVALDVDESKLRTVPEGEWIKLSPKEAQLLRHLMRCQDHFLSHEDLCAEVWKDVKVSPKSVASHVSRLRRHLSHSNVEIRSIYGGGYQLVLSSAD